MILLKKVSEVTTKVTDKLLIYKTYFHFDTLTPRFFEIALTIFINLKFASIYIFSNEVKTSHV